jgi:NSS family neurotransmitter:Na+ symporter
MEHTNKTGFSTKLGVIMAAAGSAVGLGNIWKFPYVAGENGGGAFLIVYLLCVLLFGLPLLTTELLIGKRSGRSAYGAFRALRGNSRWQWLSWWCIASAFIIMGFYFVVTGWCGNYLYEAALNTYTGMDATQLTAHFSDVVSSTPRMILCGLVPVLMTAAVLWFDVNKGIERMSKLLMPLLLIMMVVMAVRALMLPGSGEGLRFLFRFDFGRITPQVVMMAVGQCFFSLSVGTGALITYGAYMPKQQSEARTALQVALLDTLVAVLAGVVIFPAVFSFGYDPAEGPQLVFVVLPSILQQMSFSWLSGVLFFLLLFIAALTSTISLMEIAVASLCEAGHDRLNRHQSVLIVTAITTVLVILCVLSPRLFSWSDRLVTTILMPLGALSMSLFVGWFMPRKDLEVVPDSRKPWKHKLRPALIFALRWIVPAAILLIFLNGLGVL